MIVNLPDKLLRGKLNSENVQELCMEFERNIILKEYTFPNKPSSDGYYHIYLKDPSTKSGRRQIKAKTLEKLKDKVYEFEKGEYNRGRTFKFVFELAEADRLKYIKDPEKILSAKNTIYRNQVHYKRFFYGSKFENIIVSDITKEDIETVCYDNLSKYNLKKKAFLSLKGIIKEVMKYAYEQYWIQDNAYDRVDFKKFNTMFERVTPIEKRAHNDEEYNKILACIAESHKVKPNYLTSYALELQMRMGLRVGEVPPLRWSDVKDGFIQISREMIRVVQTDALPRTYYQIVEHTKTWKDRRFPITKEIAEILEKIKDVHNRLGLHSECLFPSSNKYNVMTSVAIYKYYVRTCDKLGIEISADFKKGTHSFRRNAITDTINKSNGNIILASKLYGNTPQVANSNYYTGLDLAIAKDILEGNQ